MERDEFLRGAWKVMVAQKVEAQRFVFVDEMGTNTSLSALYAWAPKGRRALCSVPRNRGKNTTLLASMTAEGMGPCLAVVGSTTKAVFETYLQRALCPILRSGQIVVMDNLTAHKGERVKELIEQRGCELLYLPAYSPDFNPIEEAFAKIKGLLCEKLRLVPERHWWRRWVGRSGRSRHKTPIAFSSIAGTACRFNRYDGRCSTLTTTPLANQEMCHLAHVQAPIYLNNAASESIGRGCMEGGELCSAYFWFL